MLIALQDGGFYSAEDADSYSTGEADHKREGAFCVWTHQLITSLLTRPIQPESDKTMADLFCHHYGVEEKGNVDPHQVTALLTVRSQELMSML